MSEHTDSQLVYLTAEFQPFSSQFKPDLILVPLPDEKKQGETFLVEYKFFRGPGVPKHFVRTIPEHKEFVREATEKHLYFAFATNTSVGEEDKLLLENEDVTVFSEVTTPEDLVNRLLKWICAM